MSKQPKLIEDNYKLFNDTFLSIITDDQIKLMEDNYKSFNDTFLLIITDDQIFKIFNDRNYNMIKHIISNKINFDFNMVYMEKTLLFNACYNGYKEVVRILLANSATDVNQGATDYNNAPFIHPFLGHETTDIGSTPLIVACEKNHCEVVDLLLKHPKIDVNKTMSVNGSTPLTMACWKGHNKVVELLLAHPMTDVNKTMTLTNSWDWECQATGVTSLIIACHEGHEGVVQLLLSHPETNVNQATTDYYGIPPFFCACWLSYNGVAKLLLEHPETDVNQTRNWDGATPLYISCEFAHESVDALETVRLLLAHPNTNVNQARTYDEDTPLSVACARFLHGGVFEAVKLMLSDVRTIRTRPAFGGEVYDRELKKIISKARFRGLVRAAIVFRRMRLRAAKKVYTPGGLGYQTAAANFNDAIKLDRTSS